MTGIFVLYTLGDRSFCVIPFHMAWEQSTLHWHVRRLSLFILSIFLFCSRFETFPLKNSTNNNSFDAHKTAAWMLLRFLLLHFSNGLFCKCLGDHSKFNLYKQDNKTVYWWLFSWCFFLSLDFLCDFIVS